MLIYPCREKSVGLVAVQARKSPALSMTCVIERQAEKSGLHGKRDKSAFP